MVKSVLISIHPDWCALIASGKKTIEVRKTRPMLYTPFKCYIYCTKEKVKSQTMFRQTWSGTLNDTKIHFVKVNGKVIGEFVCDKILDYEAEFVDDSCQNSICKFEVDEEDGERIYCFETSNEVDNPDDCKLCKNSCLSFNKIKQYISKGKEGFFDFSAWHISDLVIYDEPKELSEFYKGGFLSFDDWYYKLCIDDERAIFDYEIYENEYRLKHPPQSWCYVASE